jgi:hypothetical protein
MLSRARRHATYANVVSTLCLFIVLGGSAVAAVTLKRNSVKAKHIARNAVSSPKVRNFSLRSEDFAPGQLPRGERGERGETGPTGPPGSDAQFNGATAGGDLKGTYPNPHLKPEIVLGTPGLIDHFDCDPGAPQWVNVSPDVNNRVGVTRDPLGIVHLSGVTAKCGFPSNTIFTLPAGTRPERLEHLGTVSADAFGAINVEADGDVVAVQGQVALSSGGWISLDGLTFRCGPPGTSGCP